MNEQGFTNAINQGGAIGIVALLLIGGLVLGKWVALPMLTTWLAISKEQSTTAITLKESLDVSVQLQQEQKANLRIMERMTLRTPPQLDPRSSP